MSITYTWENAEKTLIRVVDDSVDYITIIPVAKPGEETNEYREFLELGIEPEPFVEPEPPVLTTEEKVNRLLSDYGLTREEMRTALQVKTGSTTKKQSAK